MNEFKFNMRSQVKSSITGFEGTILMRQDHANGCNRYWVEPTVDKEGNPRKAMWLDEHEIEVINDKNTVVTTPDFKFNHLDEAKSTISGFTGKINARSECADKCNRYSLQPKVGKDGKLPDSYWFDEPELSIVKKNKPTEENIRQIKAPGGFHDREK